MHAAFAFYFVQPCCSLIFAQNVFLNGDQETQMQHEDNDEDAVDGFSLSSKMKETEEVVTRANLQLPDNINDNVNVNNSDNNIGRLQQRGPSAMPSSNRNSNTNNVVSSSHASRLVASLGGLAW